MSNNNDKLTSRPWRVIGQLLFKGELRRFLPLILVGSLFANLLALAMPLAILQILDRVVKNNAMDTLFFITVGVVVALALSEVLNIVNGAITSWLGTRFEHNTIVKAVERLFRMPIREYNQREPGSYTEQLSATSQVAGFYSGKALLVLFDMPFIALYLVIIYLIAGWLVWIPVVILGIFALLIYTYGKLIGNQMIERHVSDDRRFGFLYEVLGGIHMVKTMMIERLMIRRYEKLKETNAGQMFKLARDGNLANSLGLVFTQVMMVTTIFGGSIVVLQGDMTPGSLAACMMLAVRSLAPLRQGLLLWVRYQEFMAADQRLKELMELPVRDDKDLKALPAVESSIELKDVSLSFVSTVWDRVKKQEYKKVKTLFDKLSLTIRKGECIALKGESGSGKSRLLALLSALETPDEGEVLYDGHNLAEYLPQSVHQRVALLPQVATVVSGTILDNLTMFDDSLNERALALSRQLGLDDVVAGLRLGYETPLGENSKTSLPEGVAQLVTIARILVREPEVILFDEANIALDMEADIALKNYLADLKGKVTLVLVTPRPSYISMADSVYTIEGGRLIKEESQQQEIKVKDAELPRPETRRNFVEVIDSHFEAPTDLSNCLLPLLEALNWKGRPRDLAEAIPHMEFELSLSGLVTTMANCDFETVSLGKGSRQPDSRLFPCLFVPERGAAMLLLERLEDDRLFVFDGAKGRETEISALSGNGEFFYFKKLETAKAPAAARHSWVVDQLWRFRRHILLILSVSFFHAIFALTPSIFVKSVYQWVLPSKEIMLGVYLLLGVLLAILLAWFLMLMRGRMQAYLAGRFEYILGVGIFQRLMELPAFRVEDVPVSHQINRLHTLERLRDFFTGPMASIGFDIPTVFVFAVALAILNPWVLVVVAISILLYIMMIRLMLHMNQRREKVSSRDPVTRWEFVNETLNSMAVIRAAGAEQKWLERLREISGRTSLDSFRENFFNIRYASYSQFLGSLTGLAGMIVSALLLVNGMIGSGTLIASIIIIWRLLAPVINMFNAATSIPDLKANIRQLDNLMRLEQENAKGVRQSIRPALQGNINLQRVSFRYSPEADPVLLGVTMNVPAKRMVAITGPDGAGKSSLLKMILRVYTPQAGVVRMDGVDIRQINTADVRAQISYMPQQFQIFYGTVAQNMRLVHPSATDEELHWAAEMAGLLDDINNLPEGFKTRISNSRSVELPNGFRQRLSLARTILKPAAVVLLDEPGTGMDRSGDEALVRCLKWLRGRSTIIIVTPRPGHLRLADNVVYLQKGSIVTMGDYDKVNETVRKG